MARSRRDRGSVLMLVPAGFLILIMLAALAFDFSHLFLAQRSAENLAESAANDAVTFGVDQGRLRAGEGVRLDQARVNEAVAQAVSAGGPSLTILNVEAQIIDDTRVAVAITAQIDYIFLKAVPGAPDTETVVVRSEATATETP